MVVFAGLVVWHAARLVGRTDGTLLRVGPGERVSISGTQEAAGLRREAREEGPEEAHQGQGVDARSCQGLIPRSPTTGGRAYWRSPCGRLPGG